jgi:hypothetical protein
MIRNKIDSLQSIRASFNVTQNLDQIRAAWKKQQLEDPTKVGTGTKHIGEFGGCVALFSPQGEVLHVVEMSQPNGFAHLDTMVAVALMGGDRIVFYDDEMKNPIHEMDHPHFNDLHSLVSTSRGFLLTSTGVDAIIEVDKEGNTLWDFWLHENGYPETANQTIRQLSKEDNHQNQPYATKEQTTHVNRAIFMEAAVDSPDFERYVLVTLFHQGQLIKVDRQTNQIEVLVDGLKCPHSVRQYGDRFVVSDSMHNRVLILDSEFAVERIVTGNYGWVQDACLVDDTTLVLADCDNHKIIFHDLETGEEEEFGYSQQWRIFQIELIHG